MQKQKKFNNGLLFLLDLLSKKREELISPFLDKDPEVIGLSFKYERNQAGFDLVRIRYITLWIDKHFQILKKDDIPKPIKQKALSLFSDLIGLSSSQVDYTNIKYDLLLTKVRIIDELLHYEDANIEKRNKLIFSYEKDKALFEREFSKYEKEINQNST